MIFPVAIYIYTEFNLLVFSYMGWYRKNCYTTKYNFASTKSIGETFLIAGKFIIIPDTVYHLNETLPFALNSKKPQKQKERKKEKGASKTKANINFLLFQVFFRCVLIRNQLSNLIRNTSFSLSLRFRSNLPFFFP